MVRSQRLILIGISFLVLSCSDFFNGKAPPQDVAPTPTVFATENAFPADFDPVAAPFTLEKMLAGIGLNSIAPDVHMFRVRAEALQLDLRELVHEANPSGSGMDSNVKSSWRKAMLAFHAIQSSPVGPLSDQQRALTKELYSWPDFSACGVDLQVAKMAGGAPADSTLLYTIKGLLALEYLLFEETLGTQCNRRNPEHLPAFEWVDRDPAQKKKDRLAYALVVSADLSHQSRRLDNEWQPERANYSKTLVDGSRYKVIEDALNAFTDSLFTIEEVKDQRLAKPLGFHPDCDSETKKCPELAEHRWAKISLNAIVIRLLRLRSITLGDATTHFGFGELLTAAGRPQVRDKLVRDIEAAYKAAQEVAAIGDLETQIAAMNASECQATTSIDRKVPVCALFQDIREITLDLKTEVIPALKLRLPGQYQGDSD